MSTPERSILHSVLLATVASALRTGHDRLTRHVDEVCSQIEAIEPKLQSLLPEANRRERLSREGAALEARYADLASRPPLFGILVGVKDIFRVEGFETRCGSAL